MNNEQTEIPETVFDSKPFGNLIIELNIARRNFRSYPKDHPVIEASFKKVINCYNKLFNNDSSITIGVARDSLMTGDVVLDKKNLVFQDFAKILYEHNIGALTLHPGLNPDELRNFNIILGLKREELQKYGGISVIWQKAKISSIDIKPIQYDLFNATEADSVSLNKQQPQKDLWKIFALGLIQGTLGSSEPNGELLDSDDDITPEALAKQLNRQMESFRQDNQINFSEALTNAEQQAARPELTSGTHNPVTYEKLAAFVNKLNPELRCKFLSHSFNIKSLSGSSIAEEVITHFTDDNVIETMEDIRQNRLNLPSGILKLIQKLSMHAADRQHEYLQKHIKETEINQKIRGIFCEHESEYFTPEPYQTTLQNIISVDQPAILNTSEINQIKTTLDSHILENHLSDIILQLMILGDDEEHNHFLVSNLSETYYYLLQIGDYEQLIHLIKQCDAPEINISIRQSLRSNYTSRECLEEMLVGLTTWGKSKYDCINRLINVIGDPFIEVLLDRLAVEENLSLRRFIMDRIQEFGGLALENILAHLSDTRWFVLRNLIIILRSINDNRALESIRHLMNHTNNRVRSEALRTCLHFQDPTAERQILYDMNSSDRETQLSAIYLAEKSRSIDVFKKLTSIITKPGFSSIEYELKSAAIQALGEIGKVDAIPDLAKLLSSKSLLNNRQLSKLKIETIRSLRHYPVEIAKPILLQLSTGSGDIASQASETLKQMAEKVH